MKSFGEMIGWLVTMEKKAADMYKKAETAFPDDPELTALLADLHRDETLHHDLMKQAERIFDPEKAPTPLVTLDEASRREPEELFSACGKVIERKIVDKMSFLECVVCAEFSEYNELFLYVVNTLKRTHREFIPSVVKMEHHRKSIERYLKSNSEYLSLYRRITRLPKLWDEKILVVDDSSTITDVLSSLLENEGNVVTASNGREALDLLGKTYFSAVISDVEMPVMNGMEFYREAVRRFPEISRRFLFFSSTASPDALAFFRENGLRHLAKPTSIKELKGAVIEIING